MFESLIPLLVVFLVVSSIVRTARTSAQKKNTARHSTPPHPENSGSGTARAGSRSQSGSGHAAREKTVSSTVDATVGTSVASSLQEISSSVGHHNVEASSIAGHYHVENSMTGFGSDCPPKTAPVHRKVQTPAAPVSAPSGRFTQEQLRNGIVLAEILGKPKALRR